MLRSKLSLKRHAEIEDLTKIKCACCGHISLKKDVKKSRIELPETAETFLKMTQKLKDETLIRIAHLQSVDSILLNGVYYHATCLCDYERKYKKELENENKELSYSNTDVLSENEVGTCDNEILYNISNENLFSDTLSDTLRFTNEFIKSIEFRILSGEAFELSSLTETIKNKYQFQGSIDNRIVKNALIDNFGENISFSYPKQKNRSALVFYSKLSKSDMADAIRSGKTCLMKKCATDLRSTLKTLDFDLNNKYCDENDLRSSWNNFKIPENFIEFFSAFFKIDASRLKNEKLSKNNKIDLKVLKIKCIIQVMYYTMNDGRERTPLHVSTGLSIHHATRSKTIVTELNHLGLSISYPEIERYKIGLAAFAAKSAEIITPFPSHFNPKIFTIGAFDNFDHQGSSFSGKEGCHDTVSIVIQDKSLSTNFKKPNMIATIIN